MDVSLSFPRAFAFAVDDLGWNEGSDLSGEAVPGPYRAGVRRTFDIRDYQYLVEVGRQVGARIQCLFILSEMDRENVLAKYPTTTYQRGAWDNRRRINDHQWEIMKYVVKQAGYMEFGFHGTGHEYWERGEPQKRAEFYNLTDKKPWPEQSMREHIDCFKAIMKQYHLDPESGHSFPESFVPCAYSYYWNPTGAYSLGKLLAEAGVKYANTDFSQIPELHPPQGKNGGGFDYSTHVLNRINYGNVWYELSSLPRVSVEDQETDIIESHWPNWLAQDDILQPEVTRQWVAYYKSVQRMPDRYIAKNTEQLHSQWLYKRYTKVSEARTGIVVVDNTEMPEEVYERAMLGNMVLKINLTPGPSPEERGALTPGLVVKGSEGRHVSAALLDGAPIAAYLEDEGYGFVYLPPLERKKYTLTYALGADILPVHVWNDGTYNVYELSSSPEGISIRLRMYGSQVVKIRCAAPRKVISDNAGLIVRSFSYDVETSMLSVHLHASDMQGSSGTVKVIF